MKNKIQADVIESLKNKKSKSIKFKFPNSPITDRQRELIKMIGGTPLDFEDELIRSDIDKLTIQEASNFISKYVEEYADYWRTQEIYAQDEYEHWKEDE